MPRSARNRSRSSSRSRSRSRSSRRSRHRSRHGSRRHSSHRKRRLETKKRTHKRASSRLVSRRSTRSQRSPAPSKRVRRPRATKVRTVEAKPKARVAPKKNVKVRLRDARGRFVKAPPQI